MSKTPRLRASSSLRGGRLKGKGKEVLSARKTPGAQEEGGNSEVGKRYPASGGFSLAWLLALTKSFASLSHIPYCYNRRDKNRKRKVPCTDSFRLTQF